MNEPLNVISLNQTITLFLIGVLVLIVGFCLLRLERVVERAIRDTGDKVTDVMTKAAKAFTSLGTSIDGLARAMDAPKKDPAHIDTLAPRRNGAGGG